MGKTLYVSDLDGTLLDDNARMSEETAAVLNRLLARGLLFTCATARSYISAAPVLAGLNLRLPIATYSGAFLVDPIKGEAIDRRLAQPDKLRPLAAGIEQGGWAPLVYALLDGRERVSWLVGKETPGVAAYLRDRAGDPRLRPVNDYANLYAGEVFHLTIIGTAQQIPGLQALMNATPGLYAHLQQDTYNSEEHWLEFYSHDANKAAAVRRLKALAGADEVVCFGDNNNDLPMFAAADRSYAVANANAAVRAAATGVIGANGEDGVARWLQANAPEARAALEDG